MEFLEKLSAAAESCEKAEEINLDELAFLLRYAGDEIGQLTQIAKEHDRMLDRFRSQLLARCDLLNRPQTDLIRAREGTLEELEILDDELSNLMKNQFASSSIPLSFPRKTSTSFHQFASGR